MRLDHRHRLGFRKGLLAMAALASLAATTPAEARPARTSEGARLYVLDCGVLLYNSLARFGLEARPGSPTNLSNACYLIDDGERGSLIWDTGVVPDSLWRDDGVPPKKEYAEAVRPLAAQLAAIHRRPQDITYVALSHSHWDHVANLYLFPDATWLVEPYTRERLLSANPGERLDPSMFAGFAKTPTRTLPPGTDYDVFGDGRARLISAPGHTPDSRVLLVQLVNHRPVILCGDLYHFRQEVGAKPRLADSPELVASRAKIEALARSLRAEIWIGHDIREFARLRKAPSFYR